MPLPRLSSKVNYQPTGALDRLITLLTPNPTRTAGGEFLPPVTFATAWAAITALSGRDLERAQQVVAEVSHKVIIRYMSGVVAKMLVQLEGSTCGAAATSGPRQFIIEAVLDPDENQVELWLLCHERNDGVVQTS